MTVVIDGLSGVVDGDLCFEAGRKKIVMEVMAAVDFFLTANALSRLAVTPLLWLYVAIAP